jgi:hypothetical protein
MTRSATKTKALQANSTNLGWLAETSDGKREKYLLLVLDQHNMLQLRENLQDGDRRVVPIEEGEDKELRVMTPKRRKERVEVEEVSCKPKGCLSIPLPPGEEWDALFWTESAVEKFLYPYYHSQRLWNDEMDKVKAKFDKDDCAVAIAHRAPSHSAILPAQTLSIGRLTKDARNQRILTWMPADVYLNLEPDVTC